jgi:anti-anti-sigma factor
MKYAIDSTSEKIYIKILGRLTYSDYNTFNSITNAIEENADRQCVIDLEEVDFIDSAGLGMLLLARDKVANNKGNITIKGPQGQVKKMLELSKFDTIFLIER